METIHCTQSQWDALIKRVAESGRTEDAEKLRARYYAAYTHNELTNGVRHVAPWESARAARSLVRQSEIQPKAAPEPTLRTETAPMPAAPPAPPSRKDPPPAPLVDLDDLTERSSDGENDDAPPPPMAAAQSADYVQRAKHDLSTRHGVAVVQLNPLAVKAEAEKLERADDRARIEKAKRADEAAHLAKCKEFGVVDGRTVDECVDLAVQIERDIRNAH